jgi:hypothetical protein
VDASVAVPTLLALAALAGVYGLHRLALWAEARGFVYYRRRRGGSGALGNALLEVQAIFEPARRHVIEERRQQRREAAETGDPPRVEALGGRGRG